MPVHRLKILPPGAEISLAVVSWMLYISAVYFLISVCFVEKYVYVYSM